MSLDCYPFGRRQTIGLSEQPMSVDVAYDDNLVICVLNSCQSIMIYNLEAKCSDEYLVRKFKLGDGIVIDQIVYCKTGDYVACVGHKNGRLSLYAVFNWRNEEVEPEIELLDELVFREPSKREKSGKLEENMKLNCIDSCQKTGNLVVSYGDIVQIYEYLPGHDNLRKSNDSPIECHPTDGSNFKNDVTVHRDEATGFTDSLFSHAETVRNNVNSSTEDLESDLAELNLRGHSGARHFGLIITLELSIWALKVSLVENYLSIMAVDHVQVLKLELITIQLQAADTSFTNENLGITQGISVDNDKSSFGIGLRHLGKNISQQAGPCGTPSEVASACGDTAITASSSVVSDNSTTTDFSAFTSGTHQSEPNNKPPDSSLLDNSDMSIITMHNNHLMEQNSAPAASSILSLSRHDCITWNLNTKKLVKLPTLMHNTSNSLSTFHICHPSELLGPASESIACRVNASIFSQDLCRNQLEPVVLLCKQFDFGKDPVKSARLEGIYLTSSASGALDDQRHLRYSNKRHSLIVADGEVEQDNYKFASSGHEQGATCYNPLKSAHNEQLASINCFVATLTNCFVYSLQGKKVQKIQTITYPDLCLDLQSDQLNVYVLTPLGLQICSTGVCDLTFRYDWSSSADLNLSFIAHCNRTRCLTTRDHAIFIASSQDSSDFSRIEHLDQESAQDSDQLCQIEVMRKPNLAELSQRILHTVKRCQSISIRSNMLTYLHANIQLSLFNLSNELRASEHKSDMEHQGKTIKLLRDIAVILCKELLQKKQTNVITNSRIDRAVKHLLDISHCDLEELMRRLLESESAAEEARILRAKKVFTSDLLPHDIKLDNKLLGAASLSVSQDEDEQYDQEEAGDGQETDRPQSLDFELIRICLKHSKFNQGILSYIRARALAGDETTCERVLSYIFNYNPRLLIKCAQRFIDISESDQSKRLVQVQSFCLSSLLCRLQQLAEFDSTGINRATVLFTMALLYNARGERAACLTSLSQIKPHNHLAITMCSNFEAISLSMAQVVCENYPQVYRLFLAQLSRRDQTALDRFSQVLSSQASQQLNDNYTKNQTNFALVGKPSEQFVCDSEDDEEQLEKRLRLVADLPPVELADLLSSALDAHNDNGCDEDKEAVSAYLKASINLLESQFILARLCDKPSQ